MTTPLPEQFNDEYFEDVNFLARDVYTSIIMFFKLKSVLLTTFKNNKFSNLKTIVTHASKNVSYKNS